MKVHMILDSATYAELVSGRQKFILRRTFPELSKVGLPFTVYISKEGEKKATAKFTCTGYTTKLADVGEFTKDASVYERAKRICSLGKLPYFWRVTKFAVIPESKRKKLSADLSICDWTYVETEAEKTA